MNNNKNIKNRKNLTEYQFYQILRLFDVLASFPFTKSEARGNCYLSTWYIRAVLRVVDLLKT